jgi:hypothetical protein
VGSGEDALVLARFRNARERMRPRMLALAPRRNQHARARALPSAIDSISGLFCPPVVDKLIAMPPDSDAWARKFNLIRPKKCSFEGAMIGPNPR